MNRRKPAGAWIPLLLVAIVGAGCGGGGSTSPVAPVEDTAAQIETPPMPPVPQDELLPPSGNVPPDPGSHGGDPSGVGD